MSGREDGSILVEALISTAIVASILLAAFETAADSAARRRALALRREAMLVAQSRMASVGQSIPLATGAAEGREGEDLWRVEMQPCGVGAGPAGRLFCVEVSVRAAQGGGMLARLSSRRLAPLG